MREAIALSTGRVCELRPCALPFLAHYHVLAFPREQGPPSLREQEEVLLAASRAARRLGRVHFGDEGASA